jgi:REP element-mobilizing transposase RayT
MSRNSTNNWTQPISEFTRTRQNLPHLQAPGGWYWTESNTWNGLVLTEDQRDLVFDTILHHAGKKYDLEAAVVMPTHIHMIFHPLPKAGGGYYSLSEIFHSIKSYTAKQIIKQLKESASERVVSAAHGRSPLGDGNAIALSANPGVDSAEGGRHHAYYVRKRFADQVHIWQDENYDHIIRNEKDYLKKLWYLIMNPVEARLVDRPEDYRWLYYRGMPQNPRVVSADPGR